MPFSVKASIIAIILSCLVFLLAIHFDNLTQEISGFSQPINIGFGIFWCVCIGWITSRVLRKKDERFVLVILGALCLSFAFLEGNLSIQNLYAVLSIVEVALFLLAAYLLNRPESKEWRDG